MGRSVVAYLGRGGERLEGVQRLRVDDICLSWRQKERERRRAARAKQTKIEASYKGVKNHTQR